MTSKRQIWNGIIIPEIVNEVDVCKSLGLSQMDMCSNFRFRVSETYFLILSPTVQFLEELRPF